MLGQQCRRGQINSFPFNLTRVGECGAGAGAAPRSIPPLAAILLLAVAAARQ